MTTIKNDGWLEGDRCKCLFDKDSDSILKACSFHIALTTSLITAEKERDDARDLLKKEKSRGAALEATCETMQKARDSAERERDVTNKALEEMREQRDAAKYCLDKTVETVNKEREDAARHRR